MIQHVKTKQGSRTDAGNNLSQQPCQQRNAIIIRRSTYANKSGTRANSKHA